MNGNSFKHNLEWGILSVEMQIRSRLTLQFSVAVSGILLVSFALIYLLAYQYNYDHFRARLYDKAVTAATLLLKVQEIDSAILKTIDRAKRDVLYGENITVYENNKEIYTNNDTIFFNVDEKLLNEIRISRHKDFTQGKFEIVGIVFHYDNHDYVVIAGAIDVAGNRQLAMLGLILVLLFAIMTAIVAFAGWVYAGRALKPINMLIEEVETISVGDLHQRLPERRYQDEIGRLITIFNNLLARIEKAFDLQKSFVTNVSHELRNPLTRITSQLEVTLLKERSLEEYQKTAASVLEDIRELNLLSGSLLDLASLHGENRSFTMTRLRIDEILWEVIEKIKSLDPGYQTEIHSTSLPDDERRLDTFGNPYLLQVALQNVIENACKFSSDHKAIVSLLVNNGIQVIVSDHGPGIEKKDLESVFQPFYRADRTSKVKGYGIGLSLSQRIISMHKGRISVSSSVGEGTSITVHLQNADQFNSN